MTFPRLLVTAFLALTLAACSSVPRIVSEYKIDIQQGNVLTQEMVAQLKPGLSKDQVRFILGTPVLTDMFHADRWDYVYRLQKGGAKEAEMRRFSAFFDTDQRLIRVAGDVTANIPTSTSADESSQAGRQNQEIDLGSIDPNAPAPPPDAERGFFGKIWESIL